MREVIAKAGERTQILHMFSDSIPQTVRFTAETLSGAPPSGAVEVTNSMWLFKKPPRRLELGSQHEIAKGFWDSNFSIHVIPDEDVRISFQSRHFTRNALITVLTITVAVAVAAVLIMRVL